MTGKAPDVASSFAAVVGGVKPAGIEYTPMGIQAAGAMAGEPGQFGQIGTRYRNHSKQQSHTVFSSAMHQNAAKNLYGTPSQEGWDQQANIHGGIVNMMGN